MTSHCDSQDIPLRPFIEFADPEQPDESDFIAGFRDSRGKLIGAPVPISRKGLREIFAGIPYRVSIVSDGTLQPWPDDWDDDGFAAKLEAGILQEASIDALVAEMIEDSRNEPDIGADGVLSDFHGFLDRLKRATRLLEDEIDWRVARALDAGDRLVNQNEQPQIKAPGDEPEHG